MIEAAIPVAGMSILAAIALLSAMVFAASEFSIAKLTHAAVEDLIEDDKKNARALFKLVDQRRLVIFVLRGVRTFLQVVFAVSMATIALHFSHYWWLGGLVAIVIVTIVQFFANSIIATRWAQRNPTGIALFFTPAAQKVKAYLPQSERTEAEMRADMADELREMVDRVGETEGLEEEDREMLRSVFELGHTLVREVMVPRTEMLTIAFDVPARKALRLFVRSGFSRLPVIGDDTDDVRGILFFKDVVQRLENHDGDHELRADQMMRPAEFTIEMKPVDDLLRQMQSEHFHLAMVVDEYGGISGLVTLEDIIEEVVGELTDEHDRNTIEPEEISPGVWRVPSRFSISELGELWGLELEDEDVDSVGGLLAKAIGRVPLPGATGDMLGVHMVAEEARGRRRQVGTIVCSYVPETQTEDSEDHQE
ncbi:MAG: HlyC/CorC family transporter [Trueperella pyogenes]|nr:HlyC/CorC family transporter [Trueperella pyogenes]